ncbi:MAG: deoxyguanosinetriphosphate triphosphohydrolase [Rhizobiales bacterium]|nr:deoxyguanosinetriphosphate triphosphohydrolase [Hyphomicrobiales bacterium]
MQGRQLPEAPKGSEATPPDLSPRPRALAPWAADWRATRGRLAPEPASRTRGEFQRDRDRIIHSTAFRRLAHKTQVFVPLQGDHYRTRLTHTIEVAQIARALARGLSLDEDLAEAVALAHDLGHTPFGHSGEDVLAEAMAPFGGFDHNAHALRIVTALERRYADFDGLNLSWETLEGLVKHNGPLTDRAGAALKGDLPEAIAAFDLVLPLDLWSHASAEAQAAAIADDIAYDAHDIDDGLRAGLFALEDLRAVDWLAGLLDEIAAWRPGLDRARTIHELGRRVITRFVEDALTESLARLSASGAACADDVRQAPRPLVALSPAMQAADAAVKGFLYPRMYRHPRVMAVRARADDVLRDLFARFMAQPADLPAEWRPAQGCDEASLARAVADYIAGMTDRYALAEHRRLFEWAPDLR